MYFTIPTASPSTPTLSPEAHDSYQRLRSQASALAGISASFTNEALAVTEAYVRALQSGSLESWASFTAAADSIVRHSESVDPILHLDERRRAASDFFAQIARENGDLLAAGAVSAA
jgi:S-methylmethionine-dependent homocysteine/selenocysteine methylase